MLCEGRVCWLQAHTLFFLLTCKHICEYAKFPMFVLSFFLSKQDGYGVEVAFVSSPFENPSRRHRISRRFSTLNAKIPFKSFMSNIKHERQCFIAISIRRKESWKYDAQRSIFFYQIRGVWIADETLSRMIYLPNLLHGCDFLCFNLMNYNKTVL